MNLDKAIQERKSVRRFSEKKPDWRDIIECIDSARYAPMAGNNYSLRFILVDDPNTINKLAEASQQPFMTKAHYVVVVITDISKTINLYDERGQKYLKQQAGAAIENFLLKLIEKGLSTCWVGHFVDYLVQESLGIPEKIQVEAMFPIGFEKKPETKKRNKIELDRILYFNKYNQKRMKTLKKVDA
jgi:nitroreductase